MAGKMVYVGTNDLWLFELYTTKEIAKQFKYLEKVFEKFTAEEISLFFKEGVHLFEKLQLTQKAKEYLKDHPELAEIVEKW